MQPDTEKPAQATTPDRKPLLMGHPINKPWCCLSCDAVFAFGELVGDPLVCPECGSGDHCSVDLRDMAEVENGKRT